MKTAYALCCDLKTNAWTINRIIKTLPVIGQYRGKDCYDENEVIRLLAEYRTDQQPDDINATAQTIMAELNINKHVFKYLIEHKDGPKPSGYMRLEANGMRVALYNRSHITAFIDQLAQAPKQRKERSDVNETPWAVPAFTAGDIAFSQLARQFHHQLIKTRMAHAAAR